MIHTSDPRVVHAFFNDRLGLHWSEDFRGVLYVPDRFAHASASPEHVAIAVAYNSFIGRTCCMHTVIQQPEAMSRAIVRESFAYPFLRAGCEVVLALVDEANDAALDFDKRLGFEVLTRVPHGGLDGDLIILRMSRSMCRWIRQDLH